ncbi:MAG: peptidoglycan-binding domain-containing protein [Candidatus Omnitrophota bacterium]
MKKFHVLFVLGIAVFLTGCGEKSDQTATMTPSEQLAAGKEITISLNAQAPTVTEVTSESPVTTSQAVYSEVPMEAAMAVETPTNQQIQQALKNAGLYEGSIDGSLGKKSKSAIKTFQEQNGLVVDGKVGKKTWAKLSSYLNVTPSSTIPTESSN